MDGLHCLYCGKLKKLDQFYKITKKQTFDGCKDCYVERLPGKKLPVSGSILSVVFGLTTRKPQTEHSIQRMMLARIKYKNPKTDVQLTDVYCPEFCPYLGIKLDYRTTAQGREKRLPALASVDRIDSSKGYVKGNIQIISWAANFLKKDATIEEMVNFAVGVLKHHRPELLKQKNPRIG